jgi:tRNA(Ile2) C34 agmatinyltransferase TiaS
MQSLIKSLLVAFTVTAVTVSAAVADPNQPKKATAFQSSLYTNMAGKLQIAVKKETGGHVVIRLTNTAGKEFFVQQVGKRQEAARLSLDVSALPDGVYQVAISNGVETTTQELTLATTPAAQVAPRSIALN